VSRRTVELLALGAGLATFSYVGWDGALWDARFQFGLHLVALGAAVGLAILALRGERMPRTSLDLPILGLLAIIGLATLTGENPGLGARALASILATAAMLPVALVALRHRPSWVALVVLVPTLALAGGTLAVMLWRRAGWFLVDAPTLLPPIRIGAEGTPFGSVATPPFMLLAAAPLTLLVDDRRLRRALQAALLIVGVPLAILSGSRSAWIAIGVAVLAFGLGELRGVPLRLPDHPSPRTVAMTGLGLLAAALALVVVAPRLTAFGSLAYRVDLWRDTLAAWSADPLLGIGPGTMPYARQAAAEALSFPARQPHSHNLPLGLLGDAGLIGLAAGVAVLALFLWIAGPWRARTLTGRVAGCALLGLAVSGLFEDLTFLPNYNLLLVLLAAVVLADVGAVRWAPLVAPRRLGAVLTLGLVALAVPWLAGDAAAIAYRGAIDRFADGDSAGATRGLVQAEALDPWHPATPKALAVAADAAGDADLALRAARRAVGLNPGDGRAWTNLALLCLQRGDGTCAAQSAAQAANRADPFGVELANAALVNDALGAIDRADELYRLSLLTNLRTAIALPWPRTVDPGDTPMAAIDPATAQLNLLVARRVAGDPIDPDDYPAPIVRAVAARMVGDRDASEAALAAAQRASPHDLVTWDLSALVVWSWGGDPGPARRIGAVIRGSQLVAPGTRVSAGPPGLTYDIGSFRIYPRDALVGAANRLTSEVPYPWLLAPLLDPGLTGASPAAGGG
jgi:tetratricopeptide (TPR) repeat protein